MQAMQCTTAAASDRCETGISLSFTCVVNGQVCLSVSSVTSSRWARDNSWYGSVSGGELKSPQMMRAQSDVNDSSLVFSDDDDDDDEANFSNSFTANDALQSSVTTNRQTRSLQHQHTTWLKTERAHLAFRRPVYTMLSLPDTGPD